MKFRPFKRSGPIYRTQIDQCLPLTIFSPKCDSEGIANLKFLGALFVKVVTFWTLTLTLVRNFMVGTDNIWSLTHPSRLSVSY